MWEGEGSFFLYRNRPTGAKRDYFYARAVINMTDQDIIERVARLLGASVSVVPPPRKYPSRLTQHRVIVTGETACAFMHLIRPHMGERRGARIDELLAHALARPDANSERRRASSAAASTRTRTPRGTLA